MTRPRHVLTALLLVGLAALAAAPGCGTRPTTATVPPPAGDAWFQDVTEEAGLDFVHDAGAASSFFMPQAIGSGAAFFDCDGDGLLDILLLQNGGPGSGSKNRLFRQTRPGHFEDVSAGSGLDFDGHNMGVAVGDVNGDGLPDVLVTQYGGLRLFLNRGRGKFEDMTERAGLQNLAWGTSAAFLDYDRDGRLDLVVINYVDHDPTWPCNAPSGQRDYCAPRTFPGRASRLFHNEGTDKDGVARFRDVTTTSGIGKLAGPGLGVLCADFDGDGWPDVFVANDGAPNHLWINRRDGTFSEEAVRRGVAFNGMGGAEAGMGVALGDVDGNGLFDLFVTHLTEETNTLWVQEPRGFFRDRTARSDLAKARWRGTGFGTALLDFDADGALDLAVANGRVSRGPSNANPDLGAHWSYYAERNQLFAGDGTGRFRDLSPSNPAWCGTPNVARGLAWGDFDNDGAPDLLVTTAGGRARLLRNVAPKRGHWLLVRALDPARKGDAYGAEVTVEAGGKRFTGLVNPASSYLCSSDARVSFGLGAAATFDRVEVVWPDDRSREVFPGGPADRALTLRKGDGERKGTKP